MSKIRSGWCDIEITIECKSRKDAEDLAASIIYTGFISTVKGSSIALMARKIDNAALDYITTVLREDERVINLSYPNNLA